MKTCLVFPAVFCITPHIAWSRGENKRVKCDVITNIFCPCWIPLDTICLKHGKQHIVFIITTFKHIYLKILTKKGNLDDILSLTCKVSSEYEERWMQKASEFLTNLIISKILWINGRSWCQWGPKREVEGSLKNGKAPGPSGVTRGRGRNGAKTVERESYTIMIHKGKEDTLMCKKHSIKVWEEIV